MGAVYLIILALVAAACTWGLLEANYRYCQEKCREAVPNEEFHDGLEALGRAVDR